MREMTMPRAARWGASHRAGSADADQTAGDGHRKQQEDRNGANQRAGPNASEIVLFVAGNGSGGLFSRLTENPRRSHVEELWNYGFRMDMQRPSFSEKRAGLIERSWRRHGWTELPTGPTQPGASSGPVDNSVWRGPEHASVVNSS